MRQLHLALLLAPFAASCGSSASSIAPAPLPAAPATSTEAAEPTPRDVPMVEAEDPLAPKPWTGAFSDTAVMLAQTIRIEGPEGLLEHVAARADDQYYERTAETTADGFRQVVVRSGEDAPEIRVRLDRWTMAATGRLVILERFDGGPVTVTASGDAIWRDVNGELAQADRLEFVGEIGQDDPVRPSHTFRAPANRQDGPAEEPTAAPDRPDAPANGAGSPSSDDDVRDDDGAEGADGSGEDAAAPGR